jgi:uncharacterized protein (DUF488 family)
MHFFTIGHSTRSLAEFLELLKEHEIRILVDLRRWPTSNRYPQFNRANLRDSLSKAGIRYEWLGVELGGYRRDGLEEKSPNKAWRSKGFRNYADHTATTEFKAGISKLLELARIGRVALMCAEAVYWRCHRRIISDYLKALGHQVTHITAKGTVLEHELPSFSQFKNGQLTYPAYAPRN